MSSSTGVTDSIPPEERLSYHIIYTKSKKVPNTLDDIHHPELVQLVHRLAVVSPVAANMKVA